MTIIEFILSQKKIQPGLGSFSQSINELRWMRLGEEAVTLLKKALFGLFWHLTTFFFDTLASMI